MGLLSACLSILLLNPAGGGCGCHVASIRLCTLNFTKYHVNSLGSWSSAILQFLT